MKIFKKVMIGFLILLSVLGVAACVILQKPQFGKLPMGERLERIKKSPNYKEGKFQNISATPTFAEGYTLMGSLWKNITTKFPRKTLTDVIPSIKTDLQNISLDSNVVVWFGHSSVYIQLDGKRFLIDPNFSGKISPISNKIQAYKGSNIYSVGDLPAIDYLLISHDHYDHLDYKTILAIKNKVKLVVCGLGIGAHFEHWGYNSNKIIEKDWHESIEIDTNFVIHTEPSRHKTGRGFSSHKALWLSYLIQSPTKKIYISGDTGYDTHFKEIGNKYGEIDLAILENGQYNEAWHYVHLLPNETLQAAKDLKAIRLMPYHNSKFTLAKHAWDEPLKEISRLNNTFKIPLVTPIIGEVVNLDNYHQQFKQWWLGLN
jgi:L-ascorbate metabolism protein UlaG (beta-lactamase superfamily)